jgi:predicted  nucleic acid-binding Zn-ribbon protein
MMIMKKLFVYFACVAILSSCGLSESEQNKVNGRIDSLQTVINQRDSEIDELMGTFNEIQTAFDQINAAEGRVSLFADNYEKNSDALQENMKFIQETMEANRKKIDELQARLKSSGINAKKLQDAIDKLNSQMKEKDKSIVELRTLLANKDIQIAELGDSLASVSAKNEEIENAKEAVDQIASKQDELLNTAWYVYGTKSELKERRILVDGDVLKTSDFDADYFTKIDIRNTIVIPLNSKSVKILTTHPEDSYTLIKGSNGEYTLRIKDPSIFWSVSKYLVVRVK